MLTNLTTKLNSLATNSIISASKRWFIETITPNSIHLLITCVNGMSIILANSLTEINSVTSKILLFSPDSVSTALASLFWRLYLAFVLLPLPVKPAKRACV